MGLMEWLQGQQDQAQPSGNLAQVINIGDLPNSHGGSVMSGLIHSLISGATLPGDVATGKENIRLPSESPDLTRVADLVGMMQGGGLAGAGEGAGAAVGSGAIRRPSSLPMDEASRMARAKELGYEPARPLYHGTKGDFDQFDLGRAGQSDHGASGRGVYMTEDPGTANLYAQLTPGEGGPNIMPLLARTKNPYNATGDAILPRSAEESAAFTQMVKDRGHDSIAVHGKDGTLNELVVLDPANIRSKFAAFDPANEGKSMLLGSGSTDTKSATTMGGLIGALNAMSPAEMRAFLNATQEAH
jgi:hypothetical protein